MNEKSLFPFTVILLISCAETALQKDLITDVYVADFGSEDINSCRPSDVDLGHHEAKDFFLRARQVDYNVIRDNYNYAPCYIEGTMKYKSSICEWQIRAGATGHIECGDDIKYFVCDECEDLFQSK